MAIAITTTFASVSLHIPDQMLTFLAASLTEQDQFSLAVYLGASPTGGDSALTTLKSWRQTQSWPETAVTSLKQMLSLCDRPDLSAIVAAWKTMDDRRSNRYWSASWRTQNFTEMKLQYGGCAHPDCNSQVPYCLYFYS